MLKLYILDGFKNRQLVQNIGSYRKAIFTKNDFLFKI